MNTIRRWHVSAILACIMLLAGAAGNPRAHAQDSETTISPSTTQKVYFGIEINSVLCGYGEIRLSEEEYDGKRVILLDEDLHMMLTALGSKFDTRQRSQYRIDQASGNFVWHKNEIEQGEIHLGATYVVRDGEAVYTAIGEDKEERIALAPDVKLSNPLFYEYLLKDFADPTVKTRDYRELDVREGQVRDLTVTRFEDEELELTGRSWKTLVFEQVDKATALTVRFWIDRGSGEFVQALVLGRKIFRTDASVIKKIQIADLSPSLLVKTNKSIADVQGITSMKVRAKLKPVGMRLSVAALNLPGQVFEGTVTDNAVEGVFTISHTRYDGAKAPPFPADFSGRPELAAHLTAGKFCESDDQILIDEAQRITAGATNAWDAARRLCTWVAENINYAIPGGGSARKTYDSRAGECGAHSLLLTAFCRAVGIPARVVWGCMYVPGHGGGFGQHGWNEIYMGEAGWIPVDATAMEIDFVDSGHLRIAELEGLTVALNAEEFEILDYRLADTPSAPEAAQRLLPYLGTYGGEDTGGKAFKVVEQNGKLAIEFPGQVLLFGDPDANGMWPCQLSAKLHVSFDMAEDGKALALKIFERQRMPRKDIVQQIPDDTPDAYRALLGTYTLPGANVTFDIAYQDGELRLLEPRGGVHPLHFSEQGGYWQNDGDSRRVTFETGDAGIVQALNGTFITRIERKEP